MWKRWYSEGWLVKRDYDYAHDVLRIKLNLLPNSNCCIALDYSSEFQVYRIHRFDTLTFRFQYGVDHNRSHIFLQSTNERTGRTWQWVSRRKLFSGFTPYLLIRDFRSFSQTAFISTARLYGRWSTAGPAGEPLMSLRGISWLINVITIEQPVPRAVDLPGLSVTFSCWSSDYLLPVYSSRTIGRNEQINLLPLCRIAPLAD